MVKSYLLARYAVCLSLVATLSAPALAHVSYLLPSSFHLEDDGEITVQAGFSETFSRPEVALRSNAFAIITPSGTTKVFDDIETIGKLTVLGAMLEEQGTYRLTSGERIGRKGVQVKIGEDWVPLEPGSPVAEGAETRESQTATVTDVYVTRGEPSDGVLQTTIGRLAVRPVTHPNKIKVDTGFRLRVLFDGEPVANQQIQIQREGGQYESPAYSALVTSDADGYATFAMERSGAYLMMTRMSADAPAGSETRIRSYTTSLVIEVRD